MFDKFIRYVYSSGFLVALPFIYSKKIIWSLFKNKDYRYRWNERFGNVKLNLKSAIWIHSVSVGESIAVAPLIKKALKKYPKDNFVVTTMTTTGSNVVQKLYTDYDNVYHSYIPYDIKEFVDKFVDRINPKVLIIMETELWPNVINSCFKRDIPVILTNARLSYKSFRGYRKFDFATQAMIQQISHINAQSKKDAKRFANLDVKKSKITVTGNLKYDLDIPSECTKKAFEVKENLHGRPVWIAASTHKGEDEVVLKAHQLIIEKIPNMLLILVPRHDARFNYVYKLIDNYVLTKERKSEVNNIICDATQVYLVDCIGELLTFYGVANVVFVGGSLVDNGGHNLLEPAALSKPIITGESLFNFYDISNELSKRNALVRVRSHQELASKVLEIISDKALAKELAVNAFNVFNKNTKVADNQLKEIEKFLNK